MGRNSKRFKQVNRAQLLIDNKTVDMFILEHTHFAYDRLSAEGCALA